MIRNQNDSLIITYLPIPDEDKRSSRRLILSNTQFI